MDDKNVNLFRIKAETDNGEKVNLGKNYSKLICMRPNEHDTKN